MSKQVKNLEINFMVGSIDGVSFTSNKRKDKEIKQVKQSGIVALRDSNDEPGESACYL